MRHEDNSILGKVNFQMCKIPTDGGGELCLGHLQNSVAVEVALSTADSLARDHIDL
jgi:hypothetical protein